MHVLDKLLIEELLPPAIQALLDALLQVLVKAHQPIERERPIKEVHSLGEQQVVLQQLPLHVQHHPIAHKQAQLELAPLPDKAAPYRRQVVAQGHHLVALRALLVVAVAVQAVVAVVAVVVVVDENWRFEIKNNKDEKNHILYNTIPDA